MNQSIEEISIEEFMKKRGFLTTAAKSVKEQTKQIGGDHYESMNIQPIEFIHQNGIGFAEGCAIKYLCRWRSKGGIEDLKKAKHFIEMLIEMETREK